MELLIIYILLNEFIVRLYVLVCLLCYKLIYKADSLSVDTSSCCQHKFVYICHNDPTDSYVCVTCGLSIYPEFFAMDKITPIVMSNRKVIHKSDSFSDYITYPYVRSNNGSEAFDKEP